MCSFLCFYSYDFRRWNDKWNRRRTFSHKRGKSSGWNLNASSQMITALEKDRETHKRRKADQDRTAHKLACSVSTNSEHADTNPEEDADLKEIDRLIYP
eukprot:g12842.t1